MARSKDKQAPVITSVYPADGATISSGNTSMVVKATATDDQSIFQVIFQIDPVGATYPAPDKRNVAFWQAVDFYKTSYEFTPSIQGLASGEHILRVTAYDRARNAAVREVRFFIN